MPELENEENSAPPIKTITFSAATKEHLGHYVYALVDPITKRIFYVGKAHANQRPFSHLKISANSDSPKHERVRGFNVAGFVAEIDILRYGLESEAIAFEVEAAVIDAIGLENLTNKVRGHGVDRGRQAAHEVERLHGSKAMPIENIEDKMIAFFIQRTYSPTLDQMQLYDCTRQFWSKISSKAKTCSETGELLYGTALAVADSVVVGVYKIAQWLPAGSTESTRKFRPDVHRNKWEFVGRLLPNNPLLGRKLTRDGADYAAVELGWRYIN